MSPLSHGAGGGGGHGNAAAAGGATVVEVFMALIVDPAMASQ
jgi:hypothetical protein